MLSLARSSARRTLAQPLCRALATETTQIPAHARPQGNDVDASSAWRKGKIPVKEDHGLYAFFRRKANTKETGEDAYETVESPKKEISGRAWRASELRLKSFKDLHTLWYVTLRERNLLASQREEARKAGIRINLQAQTVMAGHCRKTMARIKVIMNERRLAYEGAVKLFAEHKEVVEDKKLLKLQEEAFVKAQEKLAAFYSVGRTRQRANKQRLLAAKKELTADGVLPATTTEAESTTDTSAPAVAAEPITPAEAEAAPAPETTEKVAEDAHAIPAGTEPKSAADAAAAGLFGEAVKSKQ